jgi:hypothetical protein
MPFDVHILSKYSFVKGLRVLVKKLWFKSLLIKKLTPSCTRLEGKGLGISVKNNNLDSFLFQQNILVLSNDGSHGSKVGNGSQSGQSTLDNAANKHREESNSAGQFYKKYFCVIFPLEQ